MAWKFFAILLLSALASGEECREQMDCENDPAFKGNQGSPGPPGVGPNYCPGLEGGPGGPGRFYPEQCECVPGNPGNGCSDQSQLCYQDNLLGYPGTVGPAECPGNEGKEPVPVEQQDCENDPTFKGPPGVYGPPGDAPNFCPGGPGEPGSPGFFHPEKNKCMYGAKGAPGMRGPPECSNEETTTTCNQWTTCEDFDGVQGPAGIPGSPPNHCPGGLGFPGTPGYFDQHLCKCVHGLNGAAGLPGPQECPEEPTQRTADKDSFSSCVRDCFSKLK